MGREEGCQHGETGNVGERKENSTQVSRVLSGGKIEMDVPRWLHVTCLGSRMKGLMLEGEMDEGMDVGREMNEKVPPSSLRLTYGRFMLVVHSVKV